MGSVYKVAHAETKVLGFTSLPDDAIKVWDVNTGKLICTLKTVYDETGYIWQDSITNSLVGVLYSNHKIKVWDVNTGKLICTLEDQTGIISSFSITSDSSKVVTYIESDSSKLVSSFGEAITVWDVNTGELLNTFEVDTGRRSPEYKQPYKGILELSITSDSSKVVASIHDSTIIKIWDIDTRNGRLRRNRNRWG
jgi:WD40 repeat protein